MDIVWAFAQHQGLRIRDAAELLLQKGEQELSSGPLFRFKMDALRETRVQALLDMITPIQTREDLTSLTISEHHHQILKVLAHKENLELKDMTTMVLQRGFYAFAVQRAAGDKAYREYKGKLLLQAEKESEKDSKETD